MSNCTFKPTHIDCLMAAAAATAFKLTIKPFYFLFGCELPHSIPIHFIKLIINVLRLYNVYATNFNWFDYFLYVTPHSARKL